MAIDYRLSVGTKIDGTDIQKQINALPKKTIVITSTVKGSKEVTTLVDSMGQLVTTTTKFDKSGNALSQTLNKVKTNIKQTSDNIQTASKHTTTLGSKFLDITRKVVAFGAVTSLIGTFTTMMYKAVESVSDMDASLTELKKVSDLAGDSLEAYTEKSFKMARDLSTTASNVTDATAQFVQAGYDLSESEGLSKYAIMLQSIADETMDVETSTSFLTSTIKAFNMTAGDAEKIISSVNEVSNQYALTSNDLTENLGKVAGVAGIAGVSFEELLGVMVSSVEKTRNASKSANAFKSIFINLQQMDKSGSMPKLSKQFEEFGLSMTDASGATKDAYQLLKELSEVYKEVSASTDVDKQNKMKTLLEDIGGKYNYNVLVSSLSGFETAISATETALNSANSAQIEFDKSLDSIKKKSEAVQGAFQELVWGDGGLDKLIKGFLDTSTGILKFIDDTNALNVVLVATGVILTVNLLPAMISTSKTLLSMATTALPRAIGAWQLYLGTATGAVGTTVSLSTAMSASVPIIGLVVASLSLMYMAYQKAESARKEYIATTKDEIENLKSLYTQTKEITTREELNSIVENNLSQYQREIDKINDLSEARQFLIDMIKQEQETRQTDLLDSGYTDYVDAKSQKEAPTNAENFHGTFTSASGIQSFKLTSPEDINTKEDFIEALKAERDAYIELDDSTGKYSQDIKWLNAEIISNEDALSSANQTIAEYDEALQASGKIYDDSSGKIRDMTTLERQAYESKKNSTSATKESTEVLDDEESALTEVIEEVATLSDRYKDLSTASSEVVSSIGSLASALDEQSESGELSMETQLELIDSGYAMALSYDEQTGACILNEQAMIMLTKAKIEDQIANLKILQTDIQTKLKEDGLVAVESANGFLMLAKAKNQSTLDYTSNLGIANEDVDQYNNTEAQIKALESSLKSVGNTINKAKSSTSSATSATKDATDAIKEQTEALKDQQDQYETVIDLISDKFDEEIKSIETTRDVQLDSIDDTIKAIEDQRKIEEANWDAKIDALNEQNKAINDQIELQKLQEALAKAQATKVMVLGQNGFEYRSDESAVSSAVSDINDYQFAQNQANEVALLEEQKNVALASLDAQIQAWEDYRVQTEASFTAQIANQELMKSSFEDMVNSYTDNQNNLLVQQLTGIDLESATWQTRLSNISAFVNSYNTILSKLGNTSETSVGSNYTPTKASTSTTGSTSSTKSATKKSSGYVSTLDRTSSVSNAYASGVASIGQDELALVGENPELVVGSRANGQLMNLSKGSGVVNAESTKSWAGILNTLGSSMGLNGQTMGMSTTNQSNVTSQSIQIANITLPSVTNGQGLLDELRGFSNNMMQKAYSNA